MADKKDDTPDDDKKAAGAEGAESGGADAPKKSLAKKLALFAGAPILLLILLGAGAWKMGFLDKFLGHDNPPSCENVKDGDDDFAVCQTLLAEKSAGAPGVFTEIPPMIVNLSSTGKQPRFLKISLKIETENDIEQKKLEAVLPRVIDQFQMYLRELRIEDLRGTSGIYRMKIELLSRIRAAATNVKIRDVLFQEILVQ